MSLLPDLRRPLSLAVTAVFVLVLVPVFAGAKDPQPPPPASAGDSASGKAAEYVKLLQKVNPRDAEGFYQIGRWCEEAGLADKAARAYERAIRIDPDHALARKALGYRPFGLEWTKDPPSTGRAVNTDSPGRSSTGAASTAQPGAGASTPAAPKTAGAGPATDSGAKAESVKKPGEGKKPPESEAKTEAVKVDEAVAQKKKWAQEAAAKLEIKLSLYEDEDFLIHSTYEAGSPRIKTLAGVLKNLKKQVLNVVGKPRGPIWPGKLQFVYMRASTECMRFSEAIDGQRFPEEEGWYAAGDQANGYHAVLSGVAEMGLAEFLGWTALERLGNSDRYVGTWMRDGVKGLVAAGTEQGKHDRILEQAFTRTGNEIQANFEQVSLIKLLESVDQKPNARELYQAEAVTFVWFLNYLGTSKFHELVQDLKSPEAPALPQGEDKLFFSRYTSYQERAIVANFHEKLEKLNEKWKAAVSQKAAEIEKSKPADKPQKNNKAGAKNTGGKNQGGKAGSKGEKPGSKGEKKGDSQDPEKGG